MVATLAVSDPWHVAVPGWAEWDDGPRPYLEIFLALHCPYSEDGIRRVGTPTWNEDDFHKLLTDLQHRGYGWLRPEGVRRQIEKMTREWQGPPPLSLLPQEEAFQPLQHGGHPMAGTHHQAEQKPRSLFGSVADWLWGKKSPY